MHQPITRLGAALALVSLACTGGDGSPDTEPPSILFVSPRFEVVWETVTIAVLVDDDRGVAGVRFLLDGVDLGPEDQTEPYSMNWNTRQHANGFHTLTVTARDAAGNQSTTVPRVVSVSN